MGRYMLQGGAEFGGRMRQSDLLALDLAGGTAAPLRIIPAAAAPDNNHVRAGENGRRWFSSLGATNVDVLPLVDRISANDEQISATLAASRLIYLLGGFPRHLMDTLAGSTALQAIMSAFDKGAVIAGSSAGAMVLCGHFYDPRGGTVENGLGLLPDLCVLPHHNRSGAHWAASILKARPRITLVGIDEGTALISDLNVQQWRVCGAGEVARYCQGRVDRFYDGDAVRL